MRRKVRKTNESHILLDQILGLPHLCHFENCKEKHTYSQEHI